MRGGSAAVCLLIGLPVLGCSGGTEATDETGATSDDEQVTVEELAEANGFATSGSVPDVASGSAPLRVEYFEALRRADWAAPDHCWFATRITLGDPAAGAKSVAFDGPNSDDDREVGEGVVLGAIRDSVYGLRSHTPDAAPVPVPIDAVNLVAAVFGHDQVAELTTEHPAALGHQPSAAQPVDGWSPLVVSLDAAAPLPASVPVTLRRLHADGSEEVEALSVELDAPELVVATPAWDFDVGGVDEECEVPGGDGPSTEAGPSRDLLGSPIGDAPRLPEPGDQPERPAAAASEVLDAIRAVYDLGDVDAEAKVDHVEDPDSYLEIRRHLAANDLVAPYLANLDPEFRSVVFVSPTEAHLLYRVGPGYQWEIGRVLLIDGRWRVAAGTLCRDLAAAGYTCPGIAPDAAPGPLG